MNESPIIRLSSIVRESFEKPSVISSPWAPVDLVCEILKRPKKSLKYPDYSVVLMGDFEESIWFLPDAFSFMLSMDDDYYEVASEVVGFIFSYRDSLAKNSLWEICVDCLGEVFLDWAGTVRFRSGSKIGRYVDLVFRGDIEEALSVLWLCSKQFRIDLFGPQIVAWKRSFKDPKCFFRYLDLLYIIRTGDFLFEYEFYHEFINRFDELDCDKIVYFWGVQKNYIEGFCPPEYFSVLCQFVDGLHV